MAPVRPFAVYGMELQRCRSCMGPFDIDVVVLCRISCMAHKNNGSIPGEGPRIQALIGSVLIQMDNPVIGLEAGHFGIPLSLIHI